MPLKIDDLLRIPQSDMDKVKIKFNQPSPDEDPLVLYRKNPDIVNTRWLFGENRDVISMKARLQFVF